ncbi:Immunity protein 41 [Corynebacterium mustelae]|uniref:Immunity protein 41 n=1 Tax=Corynebacterium mustelae TaxID=571915 RepID=A0A0G3GUR9_9CORY|nr:imm68 putative immunity domain-containing protein [Corynebacterium mustelae]AKK04926.1 Immunity protein 41 [Corynebacterium mustelae]
MKIDQYWGTYFGESADSATFVRYLDVKPEVVSATEIFTDLGLDLLKGNFTESGCHATIGEEEFSFDSAFRVILDLSVLLIESKSVGRFNLARIGGARSRMMRIDPTPKENVQITQALKYFSLMPEAFAVAEEFDEDQLYELGNLCEEIRHQLD